MSDSKVYVGDAVYVEFDSPFEGDLTLTTENGIGATNTIVLGPYEWKSLTMIVEARRRGQQ